MHVARAKDDTELDILCTEMSDQNRRVEQIRKDRDGCEYQRLQQPEMDANAQVKAALALYDDLLSF